MLAVLSGSAVSIAWQFWLDVLSTVLDGAGIVSASPNLFDLCKQSCVNGWYLETSSLGLLLLLPDFINTDLRWWDDPEWLFFFHLVILAYLARGFDPEQPREVGPLAL
jgi:hypothetical protein